MAQVPIPDSGGDGVRWVDEDSAAARNYFGGGSAGGVSLNPAVSSGNWLTAAAAGIGGFLTGGTLPAIGGLISQAGGILKGGGGGGGSSGGGLQMPFQVKGPGGQLLPGFGGKGGSGKRYRRMNPMNVKALRRAVRRIDSGEKLFRKVFVVKHHKSGTIVPKRRKRA